MVYNYTNIIMNPPILEHTCSDSLPPYKIYNYITSPRKITFQQWLEEPISNFSENLTKYGNLYTHNQYISDYCHELLSVVYKNNYTITDEKQFKNEIATFIYRLSRERYNERHV